MTTAAAELVDGSCGEMQGHCEACGKALHSAFSELLCPTNHNRHTDTTQAAHIHKRQTSSVPSTHTQVTCTTQTNVPQIPIHAQHNRSSAPSGANAVLEMQHRRSMTAGVARACAPQCNSAA